jgi:hypothetical protein
MSETKSFTVRARWDEESETWWTDGEDVPGLCVQASTFDHLVDIVMSLAPRLLIENGIVTSDDGYVEITIEGNGPRGRYVGRGTTKMTRTKFDQRLAAWIIPVALAVAVVCVVIIWKLVAE